MAHAEYETTFILRPDLTGTGIEEKIKRMTETVEKDGKIKDIDHWGARRLAYPIEKQTRGIYVHAKFVAGPDVVAQVERDFRLTEDVLRYLTIKVADNAELS